MQIIAFVGQKKSGKDFFCQHLVDKYGAKRLSFSDEVRRLTTQLYPWMPFDFDPAVKDLPFEHINNPNGLSPREIWLTVGKVRDVDPHYFVRMFHENQWPIYELGDLYIITDLRTEEEYMFLKEFEDIPIIKIEIEDRTGIQEDDFEQWTRDFTRYDKLFINKLNGTEEFDKFFEVLINDL